MTEPEVPTAMLSRRDIAVAGVSFAISGVGGAYLQRWLSRAKPSLNIVAFGFDGTPEPFKLSDDLRQKSDADSWGKSLEKTSTFDALRARYRSTLGLIKDHETAIPTVDKWLQQNRPRVAGANAGLTPQLSAAEIDSHAYFQDALFGSALIGNIRRLQIPEPPVTDFSKWDYKITVLDRSDKAITVQIGRKVTRFPLTGMNSEQKRRLVTLMAESFARGIVPNIIHYSEFFLNGAREDLLKLKSLEEPLRDTLTQEARLTVNVAFRNAGDVATVFRQYYAAALRAKQFSQAILLAPIERREKRPGGGDLLSRLSQELSDDEEPSTSGSDLDELSKILPSAKSSQLQGIGPGEVKQTTLQSLKPLGDDGKKIVSLFQNDVIECEVFGFLADGTKISSNPVPFGKSAVEREQQDVVKQSSN